MFRRALLQKKKKSGYVIMGECRALQFVGEIPLTANDVSAAYFRKPNSTASLQMRRSLSEIGMPLDLMK